MQILLEENTGETKFPFGKDSNEQGCRNALLTFFPKISPAHLILCKCNLRKNSNRHCRLLFDLQMYQALNIRVALTSIEIWTEHDRIFVSSDAELTLTNFLHYYDSRVAGNDSFIQDHAALIRCVQWEGGCANFTGTALEEY